ncbi:MAG: efflux RND transporter periplasmic adaptor subunit, partial [Bacteroidota bacterium]
MDQPIQKQKKHKLAYAAVPIALGLGTLVWLGVTRQANGLTVSREQIQVKAVVSDQFYEYISLSASVEPSTSRLLDSRSAGTVDRILQENGSVVERGDTLLKLSNPELELEVMQREGQLIEQLNAQRQTMLLINQNDFALREQIIEVDYQLELERLRYQRATQMLEDDLIALAEYEPTAAQFDYYTIRKDMLSQAYRQDSVARSRQLSQISAIEGRLLDNLKAVGQILDRLYVLAPISGRLSSFEVQAGQSISTGDRIGEIYQLDQPQLEAEVDEYYLDKIELGQSGRALLRGDSLSVRVSKIFPSVTGGRFRVRLELVDNELPTPTLVKGQSVRVLLYFGRSAKSVLLPEGEFYNSTGGDWVFVLEGEQARRVDISLGRRNPDYYEVISGLHAGEQVIVSDYRAWLEYSS